MTSPQITLTDRYIAALQQQLPLRPLSRRRDIDIELRALIADAIEHRVSAGSSQAQAEFDAVAELGNPARLAADYSDRPTALLGAEIFPDYRRLMRILLSTVIPGIAVMLVVAQLLAGRGWPEVLATTIAITATVAMHALFWTTLLFVILERVPSARAKALAEWEPSALPETPDGREGIGETIAGIAFVLGFLALLVVSPTLTSATDSAGNPIGLISPTLIGMSALFFAIVLVASAFGIATEYLGWTYRLAVVNTVLNLFGMALLIWLVAGDYLFDPAFFESIGWPSAAPSTIGWVLVVLALLNGVRGIVSGFVSAARRARVTR